MGPSPPVAGVAASWATPTPAHVLPTQLSATSPTERANVGRRNTSNEHGGLVSGGKSCPHLRDLLLYFRVFGWRTLNIEFVRLEGKEANHGQL